MAEEKKPGRREGGGFVMQEAGKGLASREYKARLDGVLAAAVELAAGANEVSPGEVIVECVRRELKKEIARVERGERPTARSEAAPATA
jgi:hypothetical protein